MEGLIESTQTGGSRTTKLKRRSVDPASTTTSQQATPLNQGVITLGIAVEMSCPGDGCHQQSHGEQLLNVLNLAIIDLVASRNASPTPMAGSIAVPSYHSLKEVM